MNPKITINDIGEDPKRTEARERANCCIAVFIGETKDSGLILNADTPEREQQFAGLIAGLALEALGNKWYGEARTEGVKRGMSLTLEAVYRVCGEDVANEVIRVIGEMTDKKQ